MKNKSLLYTFFFALIAIISCILVLLIGLYFGSYIKSRNEIIVFPLKNETYYDIINHK